MTPSGITLITIPIYIQGLHQLHITAIMQSLSMCLALQWHHNGRDSVSNHRRISCLLSRLFRCRSKKISKLCVPGFLWRIHRRPVNSPHKGPAVTRKMFPFDDVIMVRDFTHFILGWTTAAPHSESLDETGRYLLNFLNSTTILIMLIRCL